MPLGVAYPFGIRDIKLNGFTDPNAETVGTTVDLPAARVMKFTEAESFEDLRGDDKKILSRGSGAEVGWELEAGGIELAAYVLIAGGTLTESGTTPNQLKQVRKKATDARPYFRARGQAFSDTGGDVHCILYRCRTTGDIEGEFSDQTFYLTKCSGTAYPSRNATTLDALYDLVYHETDIALS